MPFSIPNFPILTPDQANPYQYGLSQAIARQLQQSQSRNYNASAAAQEAKNPFIADHEKAALLKENLFNQFYPEDEISLINSRNASTRGTNIDNRQKQFEWDNPNLKYGSQLVKDITLRYLADKGGQPAVEAHAAITQDYPDAPLQQTVNMALQAAQLQPSLTQPPKKTITESIADSFMQQPGQQNLQQPIQQSAQQAPQYNELAQSLNNVLNPPQPQQAQRPSQIDVMDRAINAELSEKENRAKFYGEGRSGGLSTTGKDQALYFNNMKRGNPTFSDDDVVDAMNKVAQGEHTLDDGRHINVDYLTAQSKSKVDTQGHPAAVTSAIQQANQAEAEIDVLKDQAQAGMGKYGDTYAGYSPEQIADTFKSDPKSQKELGRFIAGQQLQYEITQNEIRIAQGKPGVKTTQDLMDLGQQRIKTLYPKLSGVARKEAQDYFVTSLKKGLAARNKVYTNSNRGNSSSANMVTIIDPDGGEHELPEENVDAAIKAVPGTRRKG